MPFQILLRTHLAARTHRGGHVAGGALESARQVKIHSLRPHSLQLALIGKWRAASKEPQAKVSWPLPRSRARDAREPLWQAVTYECASVLIALSTSHTAIKTAATSYTQLLASQSDNNIKLIVLERLQDLKKQRMRPPTASRARARRASYTARGCHRRAPLRRRVQTRKS